MAYFDGSTLLVANGDVSDQTDINDFVSQVSTAFNAVEDDVLVLQANQNQAIKWARDAQGELITEQIGGETVEDYSARAYAEESKNWAITETLGIVLADGTTNSSFKGSKGYVLEAQAAVVDAEAAVVDAEAAVTAAEGWSDTALGHANDADGFATEAEGYKDDAEAAATVAQGQNTISEGDGIEIVQTGSAPGPYDFEIIKLDYTNDIFTVGATGDFATINAALTELSKGCKFYNNLQQKVTLGLQPGFVMAEQVIVTGIDLSWIEIIGADAVTDVDLDALTETVTSDNWTPAFSVTEGGSLPRINQEFELDDTPGAEDIGVLAYGASSSCDIGSSGGFINFYSGAYSEKGATISVQGGNFSSCNSGLVAIDGASVNSTGAIFADGLYAIVASNCSRISAVSSVWSGTSWTTLAYANGRSDAILSTSSSSYGVSSGGDAVIYSGSFIQIGAAATMNVAAANTLYANGAVFK